MIETSWKVAITGLLLGAILVTIFKVGLLSMAKHREKDHLHIKKLAHMGDPKAQFQLGFMYEVGLGKSIHKGKSFYWYLRSAEQGNPLSINKISQFYMEGIHVSDDLDEGLWWMAPGNKEDKMEKARSLRMGLEKKYPKTPYSFMSDEDYNTRE